MAPPASTTSASLAVELTRAVARDAPGAGIGMLCEIGQDGCQRRHHVGYRAPQLVWHGAQDNVHLAATRESVLTHDRLEVTLRDVSLELLAALKPESKLTGCAHAAEHQLAPLTHTR